MEAEIPENIKAYVQPLFERIAALEQKNKELQAEVVKINSQLSAGHKNVGKAHMTTTVKTTTTPVSNKPLKTHGNQQGASDEKKINSVKSATKLPTTGQVTAKRPEKKEVEQHRNEQKPGPKKVQQTPRPVKKPTEHKQEKKPTTAADKTRHPTTKKTGKAAEKSPVNEKEKHQEKKIQSKPQQKHQQTKSEEVSDSAKQFQSDLKKEVVSQVAPQPEVKVQEHVQVQVKKEAQIVQEQTAEQPTEQPAESS